MPRGLPSFRSIVGAAKKKAEETRAAAADAEIDLVEDLPRQVSAIHARAVERGAAYDAEKDVAFYSVVVFKSKAQRDAFWAECGMPEGLIQNGVKLASVLGKKLPDAPKLKEHELRGKWEKLVKR